MINIIIGIILALVTTFCFNIAIVYQKKGLSQGRLSGAEINLGAGFKSTIKTFIKLIKNKNWAFGALLGVVGWVPYIISIGLVGIIVTEPVMATGFIFFVIAANRILHEKVGVIEYMAIGMLTISPILIALAGISNLEIDLVGFVPSMMIFLIITVSASIISLYFAKRKRDTNLEGLLTMFGGAILFALGGVSTNILVQALIQAVDTIHWYVIFQLPFGIFWFFLTSSYPYLWVFLGFWMMAIFNLSSLPYYQGGYQKGKILIMYPLLDSVALLLPIFAGLIVFQQTFENFYLFILALILIVIASFILSKYQVAIEKMEVENQIDNS
jgi:drug/metabolite transporter (DMT)-like permease